MTVNVRSQAEIDEEIRAIDEALAEIRVAWAALVEALPRPPRPRVCTCGLDRSKSARLQREVARNVALRDVLGLQQSITENA